VTGAIGVIPTCFYVEICTVLLSTGVVWNFCVCMHACIRVPLNTEFNFNSN
jgi:hypothetical protein